MRHFHFFKIFLFDFFLFIVFILSCNNWDLTDPGPQPIILEDTEHQPKLNVLGILRPDSISGISQSFVHVEISYPINNSPDSTIVPDAEVKIIKLEGNSPVDSSKFIYSDFDVFSNKEYRNQSFFPKHGAYQLICNREGYPTIIAQTNMPRIPQVEEGSLELKKTSLTFNIIRDDQVGLYEVVLQGNTWLIKDRFLRSKQGNIKVDFSLKNIPRGNCIITIYAFDNNLSEYFTANLSSKPNIYQKEFRTVKNGYAVLGR
jgi:hypothetical protein